MFVKREGTLHHGARKDIRDGKSTLLLTDNWLDIGPIRNLIEGPLTQNDAIITVRDCRIEGLELCNLSFDLPNFVINFIHSICIAYQSVGQPPNQTPPCEICLPIVYFQTSLCTC